MRFGRENVLVGKLRWTRSTQWQKLSRVDIFRDHRSDRRLLQRAVSSSPRLITKNLRNRRWLL